MGAGSSSLPVNQHRTWSVEPPPLPAPPFLTGCRSPSSETSTITRDIEDAAGDVANKASSAAFDGPASQGPSPYMSLRRKGCWQPESLPPSSRNSRQDSLLTYAPEIVGWPPTGRMVTEEQQERLELTRTVSHLAAATQQLATAQNVTLMHLESVYDELKREREGRKAVLERRQKWIEKEANKNYDQHVRGVDYQVTNLDTLPSERLTAREQRKIQRNLDTDLKDHLDNAAQSLRNETDNDFAEDVYDDEDQQKFSLKMRQDCHLTLNHDEDRDKQKRQRHARLIGKKTVASKLARRFKKFDQVAGNSSCRRVTIATNEIEVHDEKLLEDEKYQGSRNRNVEAPPDLHSDRMSHKITNLGTRQRPINENERMNRDDVCFLKLGNDDLTDVQEVDDSRGQLINARLKKDLEAQQRVIEKLNEDYEVCKKEYKFTEDSLVERTEQVSQLSTKLDKSKQEISRLLKELETFQYEKAATDSRISNLEQDLLEKDTIRREEFDETNSLRSMLSKESSDKKKCLKELEDAKEEIKKLKQMIEADRDNRNSSYPGTSQPEDSSNNVAIVGEEFKKELILKREARQRAIAAVSSEMERLRQELDAEKVAHSETSKILELLKSAQFLPLDLATDEDESNTQICKRCSDNLSEKLDNVDINLKEETEEEESGCSEAMRLSDLLKISDEVMNNIRFQLEKAEDLYYQLDNVPEVHKPRILSLKKLADDMRESLRSRERQVGVLKDRLSQILVRLGNQTFLDCTDDIRLEHNCQFEDLLNLRRLYEERSKVLTYLKDSAIRDLKDVKSELKTSKNNNEILEEELKKAEEKMDVQDAEVSELESQLGLTRADCRDLQNQMSVINKLFTQMLLGASSADMDLDRLTQLLQENHDLISDMTRDSGTEAAALPKLLLDLIKQVEGGTKEGKNNADSYNEEKKEEDDLQEENIAHNLPKVWRVLLELIRCHAAETSATSVASSSASDCCYKSIDTPTGPQLVISVSKTYIRLKDLIVEKKSLEKEMNRMKQLNSHLEGKLVEQEKRLSTVSDELTKTWTIVDRMQAQHQQLHTHEKILRYELQQKRKMLQELKQELEYCREKWESARQKNTKTEIEWRILRREFAARKAVSHADSLNNSAESGFSDERDDESDEEVEDEDEKLGKRVRIIGSRKRSRKENSRAATPDTEPEQPTDTEVSESKTISSRASEQQVSTPEEENIGEVENTADESVTVTDAVSETEVLNPLDRALTRVIQNLLEKDETSFANSSKEEGNEPEKLELTIPGPSSVSGYPKCTGHKKKSHKRMAKDWTPQTSYEFEDIGNAAKRVFRIEQNLQKANENSSYSQQKEESVIGSDASLTSKDDAASVPLSSVFSIGPFPAKDPGSHKPVSLDAEKLSLFNASVSGNGSLIDEKSIIAEPASENRSPRLGIIVDPSPSPKEIKEVEHVEFHKPSESEDQSVASSSTSRNPDEVFAARAARLKRLEEQADWLVKKMNATSQRGSALSTRLEELHETYGSSPGPPPMPDVLPSFRLQTEISLNQQEPPTSSSRIALPSVRKNDEHSSTLDDVP